MSQTMAIKISSSYTLHSLTLTSLIALFLLFLISLANGTSSITFEEATIQDLQLAFSQKRLTSKQLVDYYLHRIQLLNPALRAVVEVNPDAKHQAEAADREREDNRCGKYLGDLHGIPVLLKESIATKDKLNTTVGSYALLGSLPPRDAGVVKKLRRAGAIIIGKSSVSEWYSLRSFTIPEGWSARAGQGMNPYVNSAKTCGSSSGSAIAVAANMVAVSLGTETDGSIICPADYNSVVGLKPTVGLTSRAGVVPISPRMDTVGPITRTVSDAVYVLDAIVGFDQRDSEATKAGSKFIPEGGYKQFLKKDGLEGKRLGIVRNPFLSSFNVSSSIIPAAFEKHLNILRQKGAIIVDNLEIANIDIILNPFESGESVAMLAEFKLSINDYLKDLISSPVRSLADIIAFNINNAQLESIGEYEQEILEGAEATNGIGKEEKEKIEMMEKLSKDGLEKLMKMNELDSVVTIGSNVSPVFAIGGYPAITVPAGYDVVDGMPFGICFGGLKGTEAKLIEIAFAFEQATMLRRSPPSSSFNDVMRKLQAYPL